jgi:hypothetical protein
MCVQFAAARAGLFAEPTDDHPFSGRLPAYGAGREQSKLEELTPLGVIAFEHNVNLHSMQAQIKIALQDRPFTGSLFRIGDATCKVFD